MKGNLMKWYEVKETTELGFIEYHIVCNTQVAIGMTITERIISTYKEEVAAKESATLLNETVDPYERRW